MTKAVVDSGNPFTFITTGMLDRLFPGKYRDWIIPTTEALDSATYHALPLIGKLPQALLGLGSVRLRHNIHVSEQKECNFLIGNDVMYGDITYVEGKYILIRLTKNGSARECIPVEYGAPVMYGTLTTDVNLEPGKRTLVWTTIQMGPTTNAWRPGYSKKLNGKTVSIERIRTKGGAPDILPSPQLEQVVVKVDAEGLVPTLLVNTHSCKVPLTKGTKVSRIIPMREVREGGLTFFIEAQTSALTSGELLDEEEDDTFPECETPGVPQSFFIHSHEEDLRALLEGAPGGEMPLPAGYEGPAFPDQGEKEFKIEDIKTPYLTKDQREEILNVCRKYPKAWARHEGDVGTCTYGKVNLDTGDSLPVADPYRPIGRAYVKEAASIIKNMEKLGVIEESDSPWGANLIIAMKPNGKIRICVDLRSLNRSLVPTTKSAFPIPQVEESFEKLGKAEVISKFDLIHGYWSLLLDDSSKARTAFYFLGKLYQFTRCPFGGSTIPARFCQFVSKMLRGLEERTFAYFDDILSLSNCWQEHIDSDLPAVLDRLVRAGFKCRPSKCQLGVPKGEKIDWLGHIIVSQSLLCDPVKVKSISEAPPPRNAAELLRLLSAAAFLRRSIPDFAEICAPLYPRTRKGIPWEWPPEAQIHLDLLQLRVSQPPALRLPRYEADLVITSDSSQVAAGGMLSMYVDDNDGKGRHEVACGYVSRKYTEAEAKRWTIPEMELAALSFTIFSFAYYLEGKSTFTVRTDAASLLYLHRFKNSNPRLLRQSLWLQGYRFNIEHQKCKPGTTMAMADYLSRRYEAIPSVSLSWQNLRNPIFNAISPPPWWPEKPVTQEEFSTLADKFYDSFQAPIPEGTSPLESLKILHHLKPSKESQEKVFEFEKNNPRDHYFSIRRQVKKLAEPEEQQNDTSTRDGGPPTEDRSVPNSLAQSNPGSCPPLTEDSATESTTNSSNSVEEPLLSEIRPMGMAEVSVSEEELVENDDYEEGDEIHRWPALSLFSPQPGGRKQGDKPETPPEKQNDTLADRMMEMEGFISPQKMAVLQRQDMTLTRIFKRLETTEKNGPNTKIRPYKLREGVLLRISKLRDGRTIKRVVVPYVLHKWILRLIHGEHEHLGPKQMAGIMTPAFHWPNMHRDIATFTQSCIPCQFSKPSVIKQVEIQHRRQDPPQAPNHRISVDLITGLPRSSTGYTCILTILCQFSRFVQCVALRDKTPQQVAKALEERWFGLIGVPGSIHSDQGTEVDSGFMQKVMKILGVRKTRTASYSPQGNSLCELANKCIGNLLKSSVFPNKTARFWPKLLPYICLAVNEAPTVTGYSPRELLMGKTPSFHRLPLVAFQNEMVTQDDFLQATRLGQEFMWNVVRALQDRPRKGQEIPRQNHNYKEGDFVLLKNLTIGKAGENKLRPRYLGPYRILKAYDAVVLIKRWVGPEDKATSLTLLPHHQLDAKHADVRLAHVRHIKAYKNSAAIGNGPAINPHIVNNFLKQLGCPNLQNPKPGDHQQYDWDTAQDENTSLSSQGNTPGTASVTTEPPGPGPVTERSSLSPPSTPDTPGDLEGGLPSEPGGQEGSPAELETGDDEGTGTNHTDPEGTQEPPNQQDNEEQSRVHTTSQRESNTPQELLHPQNLESQEVLLGTNQENGQGDSAESQQQGTNESSTSTRTPIPTLLASQEESLDNSGNRQQSIHPADPTSSGSKSSRFNAPIEKGNIKPGTTLDTAGQSQQSDPSCRRKQPERRAKDIWHQNWPDIKALELAPSGLEQDKKRGQPKASSGTIASSLKPSQTSSSYKILTQDLHTSAKKNTGHSDGTAKDVQDREVSQARARIESWLEHTPTGQEELTQAITTAYESEHLAQAISDSPSDQRPPVPPRTPAQDVETGPAASDDSSTDTKTPVEEKPSTHDYVNE